ncbi:sensor histidine kinase [Pseudonocardia saturnea]
MTSVPRLPRRAVTIGMVGAVAVLVAVGMVGRSGTGPVPVGVDVAVGVLACAVVAGLPRWPVAAASVLVVLAAFSPAATPPATLAVLLVAQFRPLPPAVAIGLAGIVAHAVQGVLRPVDGLPYGWWLVLDVAAHAALVAWGALLRARRDLLHSLLERAHRAEAEQAERVAAARSAERTVIAREMHDVLAHRLSLVAASAGALEYRPDAPPEQLARAAGVVRDGVQIALDELREVIGVLRADGTATGNDRPQPVLGDLAGLVEESRAAGSDVRVDDCLDDPRTLPATVGRTAYRIVQEGLTNARKHAPGATVHVRLAGRPGAGLEIEIRNPLPDPPAPSRPGGTGLVGLGERATLAGGHLTHRATGGQFRLSAALPWPG